jgi:hypothetical protein
MRVKASRRSWSRDERPRREKLTETPAQTPAAYQRIRLDILECGHQRYRGGPIIVVMMNLASNRRVMTRFTLSPCLRVVGWLTAVVMMFCVVGLIATWVSSNVQRPRICLVSRSDGTQPSQRD